MTQFTMESPTFNLWKEPWITLERPDGIVDTPRSLEYTLLHAHEYTGLYEQSPLVVAGIHRLLVAILHFALKPNGKSYKEWYVPERKSLWMLEIFPGEEIQRFGVEYAHRFDIFSVDEPFMQSSDIPKLLQATQKKYRPKLETIAYLMPEIPTGSNVIHYRHGNENMHVFCPSCAAKGLVVMPAFTAQGGSGKAASINGTPPIYILPGGDTLFHSLRASLITTPFQPGQTVEQDYVWWLRTPAIVEFGKGDKKKNGKLVKTGLPMSSIGYLHGLTFTPRRVWLKPEKLDSTCTRCGQTNQWVVRKMVYEAGESPSHVNREDFWQDPFVSYYPTGKDSKVPSKAIVPEKDAALWRNFVGLFLPLPHDEKRRDWTAKVLLHIAQERSDVDYPFRCIGMVTKQAAAVEWLDANLTVPLQLLLDPMRGQDVRSGFTFAEDVQNILVSKFKRLLGASDKSKRYFTLRDQMLTDYWAELAHPFLNDFVPSIVKDESEGAYCRWIDIVVNEAKRSFRTFALQTGHDGNALGNQARAISDCEIALLKKRKKHLSLVRKEKTHE